MIGIPAGTRLVLASASPRRRDLLRSIGLEFDVRSSRIDESVRPVEGPIEYVRRLSIEKAEAVAAERDDIVIAADTTVEIAGQILAKPVDDDDARRMLGLLAGATHRVHTGVSVRHGRNLLTQVVTTAVTFVQLGPAEIEWYVGTGEPFGKAGGYAIQGAGGALVARVDGSVSNVIGLPLAETIGLLRAQCERSPGELSR